jgi:hypothetical protein
MYLGTGAVVTTSDTLLTAGFVIGIQFARIFSLLVLVQGGLLDRSTARYFYNWLKTSLNKPTGNLLKNLFPRICAFKNNLQVLEYKLLSQKYNTLIWYFT